MKSSFRHLVILLMTRIYKFFLSRDNRKSRIKMITFLCELLITYNQPIRFVVKALFIKRSILVSTKYSNSIVIISLLNSNKCFYEFKLTSKGNGLI